MPAGPSADAGIHSTAEDNSGTAVEAGAVQACARDSSYAGFAQGFFEQKCNFCHSEDLEGDARIGAPFDVNFDAEDDVIQFATSIRVRVLDQQTMPIGVLVSSCELERLDQYLSTLDAPPCEPQCEAKTCGSDGCGGSCGICADGESCVAESGQCEPAACTADCTGRSCGDDGCGGSCGECATGLTCDSDGACMCEPQCDGRSCGDDGCGGVCGVCAGGETCSADGQCTCVPDCADRSCGDDGCGGSCGACSYGLTCVEDGSLCECVPDCTDRSCGDDGCGGSCGTCPGMLICDTRAASCGVNCTPDCDGRSCGDDGCGGSCGECADTEYCDADGACICQPDCLGRSCGDDGCGGSCGECAGGVCGATGQCSCEPSCGDKDCGSDGCGGSCGSCADGLTCSAGACTELCIPQCADSECGDDGCGGSCGTCAGGANCVDGLCVWPEASFGADVFPILQDYDCGSASCHGGARPADDLDLSSEGVAYDALVGQPSGQCGARLLVDPQNPNQSYLVHKVTGTQLCSGSKMPKTGAGLSPGEVDILRAWIGQGAGR